MLMTTREGIYELKTLLAKFLHFAYLLHGGVYSETTIQSKFRILSACLASYNGSVGVAGPVLYLFLHWHNLSATQKIFVVVNAAGVSGCLLGQLLLFVYRDSMKASIKSLDNHFHTDLHQRGVKNAQTEAINVNRGIYSLLFASVFGTFIYVFGRLFGVATSGQERTSNIFYHVCPLPLDFMEKRYGPATAYWLAFCLTAPALLNVIFTGFLAIQIVCVIPSAVCNHFWYLRCLIVEESRVSVQNFEEQEEERESEAQKVALRYYQYVRYYQTLVREINEAQGYTEIVYTLVFAGSFIGSIPAGLLLISNEDIPLSTVLSFYCLILQCIVCMIIFSYCGSFLEGINSELIFCLYESPWMYLSPRQRQHLITFMSMLQNPLTYNVLKIRPVTVVLMLRFWQTNYSINNFFRMKANM